MRVCYNSIESSLYCYGFVTNPHLAHRFIHIIPMRVVHKLCVNRLCRQDLRGCLPACFFQRRVLVFSRFFETHLSSERHINTFPHYSQSHMWTIFHIRTVLRTSCHSENSRPLYGGAILCFLFTFLILLTKKPI